MGSIIYNFYGRMKNNITRNEHDHKDHLCQGIYHKWGHPKHRYDTLEFMLLLPEARKIPKVTEQETIHATAEQQEEMERLLKKNNKE
jgi:hypothetical protein